MTNCQVADLSPSNPGPASRPGFRRERGSAVTTFRTAAVVEAEIMLERDAFLHEELAGNTDEATKHYRLMDELVEERGHIPHPWLPSDGPVR